MGWYGSAWSRHFGNEGGEMMGTKQKIKSSYEFDTVTEWRHSTNVRTSYVKRNMRRRRRHETKQELQCVGKD